MPQMILVHITAYCLVGIAAGGGVVGPGLAACGPSDPFGTQYCFPYSNICWECQDRGELIEDGELDIWAPICREARMTGHRYIWLERRVASNCSYGLYGGGLSCSW